jgi:hypothetical protein
MAEYVYQILLIVNAFVPSAAGKNRGVFHNAFNFFLLVFEHYFPQLRV